MLQSMFVLGRFVKKRDWVNRGVGLLSGGLRWKNALCDVEVVDDSRAMSWTVSFGFGEYVVCGCVVSISLRVCRNGV